MSKALGFVAVAVIAIGAYFYFTRSSSATPREEAKKITSLPLLKENPQATLANTNLPSDALVNLTAKQQSALQVLQDGYIPVNESGAIIADTVYQGKPRKSQEAFEQNIQLKYGEATPIMRTDDPLTSIITLVGGQQQAVGRSPSSDSDKYESRRASLEAGRKDGSITDAQYERSSKKLKEKGY